MTQPKKTLGFQSSNLLDQLPPPHQKKFDLSRALNAIKDLKKPSLTHNIKNRQATFSPSKLFDLRPAGLVMPNQPSFAPKSDKRMLEISQTTNNLVSNKPFQPQTPLSPLRNQSDITLQDNFDHNSSSSSKTSGLKAKRAKRTAGTPMAMGEDPDLEVNDQCVKRIKERSIREIMEKISTWRRLYNGIQVVTDPSTGQLIKQRVKRMSLERASKYVGLSKKSLDDYLL
jgi:hypothetical protein